MQKLESMVYLLELRKLESLDLSDNDFSYNSIPLLMGLAKQLRHLSLSNASFGGLVPHELGNLTNLQVLDLSHNMLSGEIPTSLWNLSKLEKLNLYNNQLSGKIPTSIGKLSKLQTLFISYNPWEVYRYAKVIDLSENLFSRPLLESLGHIMPNLGAIFLSNNQISGQIPNSLCQLMSLNLLDLQKNSLLGEIPNCLANLSSISILVLSHNKLKGKIPCFNNTHSSKNTISSGIDLYLHLNDNMLSGEIPSCLSDLRNLKVLDIGGNQLSGKMIKWFSDEKFRELQISRLRGNQFSGTIPKQLCSLPHLQIMDLGHNRFTGSIPPCLSNLTAMTSPNASQLTNIFDVSEVIQGIAYTYTSTLPYLVDIDLSFNNLVGSIPDDITKISGLLNLNLSYNQLSGIIPLNMGGLKSLVSLDLSNNKLRGSIPTSIGELYRLSHLNLSYNNLSGPIPAGNQLQTLSDQALIYAGNTYLCGDFLPKKCKSKAVEQDKCRSNKGKGYNNEELEKMELGLVVMSGFATGFWGVVGALVLNRRWSHAVFRLVEDGYNWLYVKADVRMAKARRINRR